MEGLVNLHPADTIVSEEGRSVEGDSERTWYVDPIDGTAAFVEGLAHWGPVVGCMDELGPLEGAVYMPRTGDFFWARRGAGAWLNGERLPRLSSEGSSCRWCTCPLGFTSMWSSTSTASSEALGGPLLTLFLWLREALWVPWFQPAGSSGMSWAPSVCYQRSALPHLGCRTRNSISGSTRRSV